MTIWSWNLWAKGWKRVSLTLAVAQSQAQTRPRWLSAKHSLPPTTSLPGRGEATQCRSYPSLPAERGQAGTNRSRLAWTGAAGRDEYDGAAWETGAGSCGTTSDRKPWCP